ncbi:CHAP domain-containing protein [Sphingomonas sp. SCN 67-18]|uniref:CHAP domain-containing protein n=1 Tax=uncultured Sphingomonas sp. TaxID=158754 RepID=UPI000B1ADD0D|nr:CHAP domain-containing protein [Sphingomonas sp. SCN 67-18]
MSLGRKIVFGLSLLAAFAIAPAAASAQYWQCAPFARQISGIALYGNAAGWWDQAEGRYDRGHTPQLGAVLVLKAHKSMRVGHVAMVSQIVSDREIKVTHANWSLINGARGQVERDVTVVDTSAAGDWSEVRVWYAPSNGLGLTSYPAAGFIYPSRDDAAAPMQMASLETAAIAYAAN